MIDLQITPASASLAARGLTDRREQILRGVREGMLEAMQGLAAAAAAAAPVRTGALQRAILASVKVAETDVEIAGTVSGDVGRRHIALWQEKGISDPAVVAGSSDKVMRAYFGADVVGFMRRHGAFRVPGRPFMRPALDDQRQAIFATIRQHIREAVAQ